ncbi:hypothetical protein SO802_007721 [Lithocarpus litseifolius]|uniref:RNase H type-1 domain-containing protein n=1 Tax=Lithocarpus litseifolius TaxID=425828 RepID=A0AAW2DSQ6_9ROSI
MIQGPLSLRENSLTMEELRGAPFTGQWIWKLDILPKITMFLWLCFYNSVPVKSILAASGIDCDGKCPICRSPDESIAHLLHDSREYQFCVSKAKKAAAKVVIPVGWSQPREGWFKLNSDGASFGNPGKAGGGGIIRGSQGTWVKGYARSIGFTSSIIAELWALRDELRLANHIGIRQLEVELDAKVIVGLHNSKKNPNSAYAPLLSDCRYLLDKLPQVRVVHVFREANKCTDWLAKWGSSMREDFAVFDFPFAAELETLVAKDINGLYYCRLVAASMASVAV